MTSRRATLIWAIVVMVMALGGVFLARRNAWRYKTIEIVPAASGARVGRPRGTLEGRGHVVHLAGRQRLACTQCHDAVANGFNKPDLAKCNECHSKRVTLHPGKTEDAKAARDCLTCHSFMPHDGDDKTPWRCMECHGVEKGAQSVNLGYAPPVVAGKQLQIHANLTCAECHKPHGEPPTQPRPCTGCHKGDKAPKHPMDVIKSDKPGGPEKKCTDCHKMHEPIKAGPDSCMTCHSKTKPIVPATALFAQGHPKCVGCHTPHEGGKKSVTKACQGCHTEQVTLAQEKGGKHAVCASCHTTHAVKAGSAGCYNCHQKPHENDSSDFSTGCLGCHKVHAKGKGSLAASVLATTHGAPTCSNKGCHDKAKTDTAFHAGGLSCRSCHAGHGGDTQKAKACATCHKNQAIKVAANVGHSECKTCHTPHTPAASKPACGTCHAKQSSSAPKGHATCNKCHETHSGAVGTTCTGCHATKKTAIHGNAKGGCTTCHRPHGPNGVATPPACTTCHKVDKLPGLHAEKNHQACTSCHSGHGAPRADRVTCTTCHTDRTTHEPSTNICNGCHVFRGGS